MKAKIIFFGNSDSKFSDVIFDSLRKSDCDIVAVVNTPKNKRTSTNLTQVSYDYEQKAMELGIPVFAPESPNTEEFVQTVSKLSPDLLILGGYLMLIKPILLNVTSKRGGLNFHASLLPHYRGKHPVFWAIRNGEKESGITIHHLNEKLDEGMIAYQKAVPISENDSTADVYEKVYLECEMLIPKMIQDINNNCVPTIAQTGEGSYFSGTKEEDFVLNFTKPAQKLKWEIQASPGKCYINLPEEKIFALKAKVIQKDGLAAPGVVLKKNEDGIVVQTSDGCIQLALASNGRNFAIGEKI